MSSISDETADQSIVSLADSASNFDEHVGNDVDDVEDAGDFDSGPTMAIDSNKVRHFFKIVIYNTFLELLK